MARMYGLGQAEIELGKFIARKRHHVTVFTKFGAGAPAYSATIRRLQAIPRWLFQRIPALKKTVVQHLLSSWCGAQLLARICTEKPVA